MTHAPVDIWNGNGIALGASSPKKVAYFYDSDIGNFAYVSGHPMKPHRIRLAHSLIMNYGVYKKMEIYRAKPATRLEMTQFHTDEYIDFLQRVTPENMDNFVREQGKYNVGDDCPVFDGLFEFCGISAGGSMEGAARLNRQKCDRPSHDRFLPQVWRIFPRYRRTQGHWHWPGTILRHKLPSSRWHRRCFVQVNLRTRHL
ncbi:hypothetical protein F5B19DRAFT_82490 [Rostrohypoxylon terebratum]|nr:hypothetical protein F5B19DRAFT_82490 [Rostrohypoxylon terebratum]